jgi:hypothetical protein
MLNVEATSTKVSRTSEGNVNTLPKEPQEHVVVPTPSTPPAGPSKLTKGVPLPPSSGGGGKAKYPWQSMEVGDAFFTEGAKIETFYTLTSTANKKYGRKFVARKLDDGALFGPEYAGKSGVGTWRVG